MTDMIGTDEDIERRLQEQLEGPKALFVDEERVRIPSAALRCELT